MKKKYLKTKDRLYRNEYNCQWRNRTGKVRCRQHPPLQLKIRVKKNKLRDFYLQKFNIFGKWVTVGKFNCRNDAYGALEKEMIKMEIIRR